MSQITQYSSPSRSDPETDKNIAGVDKLMLFIFTLTLLNQAFTTDYVLLIGWMAAPATPTAEPSKTTTLSTAEKDRLPQLGDFVKTDTKHFKLIEKLGEGGYGNVFLSEDNERKVAVKAEKYSHSQVHIEVSVLKATNGARCKHFCELLGYVSNVNIMDVTAFQGAQKPDYAFVVMTLLGKDLHKLRCEAPDRKFSIATALGVGYQTLKAIEELHKVGYVSRDVKPGNFAPGCKDTRQHKTIFMVDFGLCKKYQDKNGNILPTRGEIGWRGTTRYGSLQAHARQDLSRRDDLESWLYMLIESTRGTLPWRMMTGQFHGKKLVLCYNLR